MTVRITPRGRPQRSDLYAAVQRVVSDGTELWLLRPFCIPSWTRLPLASVAEIRLDEMPGGCLD